MTLFRATKALQSTLFCSRIDWYRKFTAAAQITSNDELAAIVTQFPPKIDYAFGYGSAVLHQQNSNSNSSMVDIIMSVSDPQQWHTENMLHHSNHYSALSRLGGPSFVTWLQTNFGARLYFHPYVDLDVDGSSSTRQLKYGVVSTTDLLSDLRNWDYLYLAGRMHKPICSIRSKDQIVTPENEEDIINAQKTNLLAAVSASLLIIGGQSSITSPITMQTQKLYTTIASLSYTGDFRMQTGAEDPNKITKLVETPGMLDLWETKYTDTLDCLDELGLLNIGENSIEFEPRDPLVRKQLMQHLPMRIRRYSDTIIGPDGQNCLRKGSLALRSELANIVAPAARNQGLKGIITAGPLRSWKYAMAKFKKGRLTK